MSKMRKPYYIIRYPSFNILFSSQEKKFPMDSSVQVIKLLASERSLPCSNLVIFIGPMHATKGHRFA